MMAKITLKFMMVEHAVTEDAGLATVDLHRSNLLRLQVAQLLEECQLDLDSKNWRVETDEYIQLISRIVSKVDANKTSFQERADKPISVEVVPSDDGLSVVVMGCTKHRLFMTNKAGNAQVLPTFELMVQIPECSFSGKDFMSYRYFDKKKVVMTFVARELSSFSNQVGKVDVLWADGCGRPPLLCVLPPRKRGPKFQVYLHFGMRSIDWIPKIRLAPNRTNVKSSGVVAQLYNHCLLHDVRHLFEDPYLGDLSEHKSCQAALILIKVWALQRGLWRNHDGWSESSVALMMVYLLRKNNINPRMTALQVFTVVLQTWASTNWLGEGKQSEHENRVPAGQNVQWSLNGKRKRTVFVMPPGDNAHLESAPYSPLSDTDPETLMEAYENICNYLLGPVFLDSSMTYNFLGGVSPNFMKLLTWHAQKALVDLTRSRSSFDVLFMQQARFWQQWDLYFRVATEAETEEDWEFKVRALLQRLEWGLGNRIHALRVLSTGNGQFCAGASDSDQLPRMSIQQWMATPKPSSYSPIGTNNIIIGVSIDHATTKRVVDRGPPSVSHNDVSHFLSLWGEKAQLRRFKDGAIVYAVVWDEKQHSFQNNDKWGGGYVEDIVEYLLKRHHPCGEISVSFRSTLSTIDTMVSMRESSKPNFDPFSSHKRVMNAFESLCSILRKTSLGIPLQIDAVEPLSPALRYSELFPPVPHPFLGHKDSSMKNVSGALVFDPILVQLKFAPSSKWPTDLNAIGAAKAAMLLQLADGIEKLGDKDFDGLLAVNTSHIYLGYQGYCFMLMIAADAEIDLLRRLSRPSVSALDLLRELKKRHVLASRHHSTVHAVHTLYPSSGAVVRLARRWADSHLLSGHLSTELIELLVAKVYSDSSVFVKPPCSVPVGFLRFLQLLETFDWAREPLVVDPRGHIQDEDYSDIHRVFDTIRKTTKDHGPPMYIVAPYNGDAEDYDHDGVEAQMQGKWEPSVASPEWVVLKRVIHIAKRSREHMHHCLVSFDDSNWPAVFRESPSSFKSYSLLMRVHEDLIVDSEASSTGGHLEVLKGEDGLNESSFARSMAALTLGPRALRQKVYRNLRSGFRNSVVPNCQPVRELVQSLRKRFGCHAVFFYNQNCPEVICVLWRPQAFSPMSFSVMSSENSHPIEDEWNASSLVVHNLGDLVREIKEHSMDIVTNIRVFDEACLSHFSKRRRVDDFAEQEPEASDSALAGDSSRPKVVGKVYTD